MRARRDGDQSWSDAAAQRLAELTADLGRSDAGDEWWTDHAGSVRTAANVAPSPVPPVDHDDWPRAGRHAARRRAARALPAIGPAQLSVVALVVAVGLAVAAWLVVRDRTAGPTAAPPPPSTVEPLVPLTPPGSAAPTASGEVTIDVTGRVRRPGIVVLDQGARVVDALEAAGGARVGVDLSSLNLARMLVDGEQIVVGAPPSTVPVAPSGEAATPGAPATLVNINLATEAELDALPEVGPVTAAAIIAWREEHGGFTAIDELLEVDGIGDATLEQLTPYVTV